MEVSYQYLNCASMHSGWLDPWTPSISYIPYMECHLGQGIILYRMKAPLEVLSGISHCQEILLVFQIISGNFHKSCLHYSALLVVTSKVLCRIQLFLLRLDLDQQILFYFFRFYLSASGSVYFCLISGRISLIFCHIQNILLLTQLPWYGWISSGVLAILISNLWLLFL